MKIIRIVITAFEEGVDDTPDREITEEVIQYRYEEDSDDDYLIDEVEDLHIQITGV